MTTKQLSEIILYVKDMEAQVQFYRDIMDLTLEYPPDRDSYHDECWVVFDTGPCKLALHGGGHCKFGQDAPKFVFEVDDLSAARELLSLKGVHVGKVRSPATGINTFDAEDPEGNIFSLESRED